MAWCQAWGREKDGQAACCRSSGGRGGIGGGTSSSEDPLCGRMRLGYFRSYLTSSSSESPAVRLSQLMHTHRQFIRAGYWK